jgi:hypothetical protein
LLPPKPGYKERFKCWSCDARGDVFDLLKLLFPQDTWPERRSREARLREKYNNANPNAPVHRLLSPGERQAREEAEREKEARFFAYQDFMEMVDRPISSLTSLSEPVFAQVWPEIEKICEKHDVTIQALGKEILFWEEVEAENLKEHMLLCDGKDCLFNDCRRLRGAHPLKRGERELIIARSKKTALDEYRKRNLEHVRSIGKSK